MSDERLLHYAADPVTEFSPPAEQVTDYKPKGLWVSVGEAWREWCEGEEFRLATLRVAHEVTLATDADILRLSTGEELDDFTYDYGVTTFTYSDGSECKAIDWTSVTEHHQGIIIAPYVWERRHELMWYYGWDCASGCIWDGKAINEIREVTACPQ